MDLALEDWRAWPAVGTIIEALQGALREVLQEELVGLYLGGSLATGGFDPRSSDIDFLAVTASPLPAAAVAELSARHQQLAASGLSCARELEGSYIPQRDVRRHLAGRGHPRLEHGASSLEVVPHDCDWVIHRHILREHGIAVAGPPPDSLIDPVTPDELRSAVRELMACWWTPMEQAMPHKLEPLGYRYYAVQTMCRILYTMDTGRIASKPVATAWALERIDPRWHALLGESLAWPRVAQPGSLAETFAFIRSVAEQLRE